MDVVSIVGVVIFIILFIFSAWLNVFFLKRIMFFSENLEEVLTTLGEYRKHIQKINSMEMYYGDATIQDLLEHTLSVSADIEEFVDRYEEGTFRAETKTKEEE